MKAKLLINPFEKIAGIQSLLIGLAATILAGTLGYYSKTHFDGILNLHSGLQSAWYIHVLEPIISVSTIALWFVVFALIFGKRNIRIIDIIGTQFFAFVPSVPGALLGFFDIIEVVNTKMQSYAANPSSTLGLDAVQFIVFIALMLAVMFFTVWNAVWIFNGYKVSSNLPNKILVPVYISGIIIAVIIPKILISLIS